MKVGIITYHWVPNFGANLQAYATTLLLKSMGFEPYIINYRPKTLIEKYNSAISKKQLNAHEEFINKYLNQTAICNTLSEVEKINEDYKFDILISGSDAVLRLDNTITREDLNFPNPYWLTFAKSNQKKIFFSASSMGTKYKSFTKDVQNGIIDTLSNSTVYVRDEWTKKELKNLNTNLQIHQSIDPVFLIKNLLPLNEFNKSKEPYIILNLYKYIKTDKWVKKFVAIANHNNYKVVSLPNPENNSKTKHVNEIIKLPINPIDWYSYIQNSSGYIGVRFHPIVVAISNKIPFVAFDRYQKDLFNKHASKTYDICEKSQKRKYCLSKIKQKLISPEKTFKLLMGNKYFMNLHEEETEKIFHLFNTLKSR